MDLKWLVELFTTNVDWGARIPAFAGLVLSIFALWRGRTSVKLVLGFIDQEEQIVVSNLSPHAIELTSLGAIRDNGSLDDWFDGPDAWPGLPRRIEARSELTLTLHAEHAPYIIKQRRRIGRAGCFVRIAGGRAFSNPGRLRRLLWRVRSQLQKVFSGVERKSAQS